jgi:hypothetical protein
MDDPLDLLTIPPGTGATPLRHRLLERTILEVRRQRRWRRIQGVAVLAGSFAAGFLTLAALLPPPADPAARTPRPVAERRVVPAANPVDLEWQALDRPTDAPALYHQAADAYLARGEHADALRCYGNALDESPPRDLEVSSSDSWLLIAIKHARKKEMDACERE